MDPSILYYLYNARIDYLFSYLSKYSQKKMLIQKLNINNIHFENSSDNYLLISLNVFHDLVTFNGILQTIRKDIDKPKINIVLGGTLCSFLNLDDLIKYYPEITHVCLGKGEEFLKELVEKKLSHGIYKDTNFNKVAGYRLQKGFIKKLHNDHSLPIHNWAMPISFNTICSWKKCTFCHHETGDVKAPISIAQLADDIVYYRNNNIKNFYINDNETRLSQLGSLLNILYEKMPQPDIKFNIFGISVFNAYKELEILKTALNKWPDDTLKTVNIGVEFYDQEILSLYKKNSKIGQIDYVINSFYDNFPKTELNTYLLFGLPLVRNRHIENMQKFSDKFNGKINSNQVSFFRLSPSIDIYKALDFYKIKAGPFYSVNHYVDSYELPDIRTNYICFESYDEDEKRYVSRQETYEKYKGISLYHEMEKTIRI